MIRKAPLPSTKKVTEPIDIASVGRVSSPIAIVWPVHGHQLLRPRNRKVTSRLLVFALPIARFEYPTVRALPKRTLPSATDDAFNATRLIRLAGRFAFLDSVVRESNWQPSLSKSTGCIQTQRPVLKCSGPLVYLEPVKIICSPRGGQPQDAVNVSSMAVQWRGRHTVASMPGA